MAKILAIDDKKDNLTVLSATLKNLIPDCNVITAQSGPEGIEKAKIESPDTILLDIKMPGMDGYEICKRLKEDADTRNIPVIMISAILTESKDLVKGLDIGADAYLAKPVDEQVLIAQVKTALRMKTAEDALSGQKDLLEELVRKRTAELTNTNVQLRQEIEERKQADEALQKERDFVENLFNTAPVINLVLDMEGRIVRFNRYMEEISGYTLAEVQGKDWFSTFLPVEERTQIRDLFNKAVVDIRTVGNVNPIVKKDGSRCEIEWYDKTIKDTEGNTEGILSIGLDITEKKQMEDQLSQAQKMEAIGTLAGGVAHDFNNILTTIIGNASLALMDVIKDESLRKGIEEIKIAGERAVALTRQLLAFSRKQIIQPKILDLNKLLAGIEKMLGRLIGEDVEVLMIPGPELWQVEADPGQMEQVIMNLVINARDAMPIGGKITIETATMDLDESYFHEHSIEKQPGSYVMLAVSDTGTGMDKETQEHIFEPFYTTKEKGKGTGLGLSTVYGIVKQNNGFVWVYSEPGQGTTFKIYMPKAVEDAVLDEIEITTTADLSGSDTVLIVEDDDSLRKLAHKALQQKGYKVLEAENGEDALRVSEEHEDPIDLLITDVVMPKMDGKETAERLQPLYPQMKVIYMSGYTDNAIVHHGVLAPGLNFIEKPFSPEGLARKVREVLDRGIE